MEDVLPRRWIRDASPKVANRLRESDNVGRARLDVFWYKPRLGLVSLDARRACEVSIAITVVVSLAISSKQLIRPTLHPIRGSRLQIRRHSLAFSHALPSQRPNSDGDPTVVSNARTRFTSINSIIKPECVKQRGSDQSSIVTRGMQPNSIDYDDICYISALFVCLYIPFFADESHISF